MNHQRRCVDQYPRSFSCAESPRTASVPNASASPSRRRAFVFDIDVPPDRIEKFREYIQTTMESDDAAALLAFLESMDWEASFLYLG